MIVGQGPDRRDAPTRNDKRCNYLFQPIFHAGKNALGRTKATRCFPGGIPKTVGVITKIVVPALDLKLG